MTELESRAKEIIHSMTLKEKIGQLFLLAFPGKDPELISPIIKEFGLGGSYISQDNASTFEEANALTSKLNSIACTKFNLPLILGVDQEGAWGVLIPESTIGPGNLALGSYDNIEATYDMYGIFAKEMLEVGYNTILGPCSDVNLDINNPIIGMRSFGEDPKLVSQHVGAAIRGIHSQGGLATTKHFPGHGDTHQDTHREIPSVRKNFEQLMANELLPFKTAIEAGVDFVMTAHIIFTALDSEYPATLSSKILTTLLRNEMGFKGLVITDSMNMGAMRRFYGVEEATVRAFLAGSDLIMLSEEHYEHDGTYLEKQLVSLESILHAVEKGRISQELIDERVYRILMKKLSLPKSGELQTSQEEFYNKLEAHRSRATDYATEAIKTLKNKFNLLPLQPEKNKIAIVNASPRSSYSNLMNARGIGPNQEIPAFQSFVEHLDSARFNAVYAHEDIVDDIEKLTSYDVIIALTEDYPLPGEDFGKREQQALVLQLIEHYNSKLIVIGMRSPYELSVYKELGTYVCAYSSRTCAAIAMAEFVSVG